MNQISLLDEEVNKRADERFLDVLTKLIEKRAHCRKIVALREYVNSKIILHRNRKHYFGCDYEKHRSQLELEAFAAIKRDTFYNTDCDCGSCKNKQRRN